jgi:Glycosyltransferases involved in cell wall biogenesis
LSKVQILLSTYNGAPFIAQQIESILNQSYKNCELFIRDDGSTDQTVSIIDNLSIRNPGRIRLIKECNIGVIGSFFQLLLKSDPYAEYFSFCDQDDIWLPDKVGRAVEHLGKHDGKTPAMMFTSTWITDADLRPLTIWPSLPRREPSFFNALVQNIAVGATITMNKAARDLLCANLPRTNQIIMHDWWAYLCISAFGKVHFDAEPSILYRQHNLNVVGGERNTVDMLRRKWRSFRRNRGAHLLYKQAMEFNRIFGSQLEGDSRHQLNLFLAPREKFFQRLRFLSHTKLYRQTIKEELLFRLLVFMGHI